jgi:hypothetical protein
MQTSTGNNCQDKYDLHNTDVQQRGQEGMIDE